MHCFASDWLTCTHTFSRILSQTKIEKSKEKTFEVNMRVIIGFREIGCGFSSMKSFSLCMSLNCLTLNGFQIVSHDVTTAYEEVANESIKQAATELQNDKDANQPSKIRVSIDGSWQKRGHASMIGVVTALSGGKCIGVEVLSKHCKGCEMLEKRKHSPKFNSWKVGHDCSINHHKSSGAMESIGAVNILKRSVQKKYFDL